MIYNSEMLINLHKTILLCGIKTDMKYLDDAIRLAIESEEENKLHLHSIQRYLAEWYKYLDGVLENATEEAKRLLEEV